MWKETGLQHNTQHRRDSMAKLHTNTEKGHAKPARQANYVKLSYSSSSSRTTKPRRPLATAIETEPHGLRPETCHTQSLSLSLCRFTRQRFFFFLKLFHLCSTHSTGSQLCPMIHSEANGPGSTQVPALTQSFVCNPLTAVLGKAEAGRDQCRRARRPTPDCPTRLNGGTGVELSQKAE